MYKYVLGLICLETPASGGDTSLDVLRILCGWDKVFEECVASAKPRTIGLLG